MIDDRAGNQLLESAQEGDRAAFDSLVAQLEPRVQAFIRSRVGVNVRDRLNIDEISQDTFVRAYGSMKGFRGGDLESFTRWLMGIARIAVIKAANQAGGTELELVRDVPGSDISPSKAVRRTERFDRLQEALNDLTGDDREVVYLSRIEGLPMREVAERMGRSTEAVKKLFGRALRKLRERIGDTESLHLPERRLRRKGEDHGE